jgi:hypothetical protein
MKNLNINIYQTKEILNVAREIKQRILENIKDKELYNTIYNIDSANRIIFLFADIYKKDEVIIEYDSREVIKKWY